MMLQDGAPDSGTNMHQNMHQANASDLLIQRSETQIRSPWKESPGALALNFDNTLINVWDSENSPRTFVLTEDQLSNCYIELVPEDEAARKRMVGFSAGQTVELTPDR